MKRLLGAIIGLDLFTGPAGWRGLAQDVYFDDFSCPISSKYPEWTSSPIAYVSAANPPGKGRLPPPVVTNCESPNRKQRFPGEFGGPPIGVPIDPGYNRTKVDQTISLTLSNLPPHTALKVSFHVYILKSPLTHG